MNVHLIEFLLSSLAAFCAALYCDIRRTRCPKCGGVTVSVEGWKKRECVRCGYTY